MALSLGVDFSHYGGPLNRQTVDDWKQSGVEFAIVQYSESMPDHLAVLDAAGLLVEAYVYLYFPLSPFNQTPEDRVRNCLKMIEDHNVRRLWLDVEESSDSASPEDTVAALRRCVAECEAAGVEAGIYTRANSYQDHVGDSTAFAHLPLWHAGYLGQGPDLDMSRMPADFEGFRPYNGWQRPLIWQWWNTTTFGGHSVDLNVMEVEETMTKINADGSQRFESEGNFIVLYNKGVPIRKFGSTDGMHQGREAMNFGGTWWWIRHFTENGTFDPIGFISDTEGD